MKEVTHKQYYKTVNIGSGLNPENNTHILMIYTGGTVGMDYSEELNSLIPFDFEQIMEKVPELMRFDFSITVLSLSPLIDSSDVNPGHWITLCRLIENFYEDYDGFVILHGTDTMAYSASALSFLISNLKKPIVFTGAQLPIGATRTDARDNLITALEIAASQKGGFPLVPEVTIFFDSYLLRGNRSKKVQNFDFTAFESYNADPLAIAGIDIDFKLDPVLPSPGKTSFHTQMDRNVAILKLFPGIQQEIVEGIINLPNLKGLIIETFGSGNAPTAEWFICALQKASEKGIIILNISQCTGGQVQLGKYSTSLKLQQIGVISGKDMTIEAAVTKFMFLLGNYSAEETVMLLGRNLKGEVTE